MKKTIIATALLASSLVNAQKIQINTFDMTFQAVANIISNYSDKPIIVDSELKDDSTLLSFNANIEEKNALNFYKYLMKSNGFKFVERDYFYFVSKDLEKDTSFDNYQILVNSYIFEVNNDFIKSKDFNIQTFGNVALAISSGGFTDGKAALSFDSSKINGFLNYMENNSKGKILSRPSLLIKNKSKGFVISGQNIPVIKEKTIGENEDSKEAISIERQDTGVNLEVETNVINSKLVSLKITNEASYLSNSAQASDVIIDKRELETEILVKNKETVYIGGLQSEETKETVRKVPLLGDIPLIGKAFISEKEEKTKKTLGMFITIEIIREED